RGGRSREAAGGLDPRRLDRGLVVHGRRPRAVRRADPRALPGYAWPRALRALRARRGLHVSEEGRGRAALARRARRRARRVRRRLDGRRAVALARRPRPAARACRRLHQRAAVRAGAGRHRVVETAPATSRGRTVRGVLRRQRAAARGRRGAGAVEGAPGPLRGGAGHAAPALRGLAAGAARRDLLAHGMARRLRAHPVSRARDRRLGGPLSDGGDVAAGRRDDPRRAPARRRGRWPLSQPLAPHGGAGSGRHLSGRNRRVTLIVEFARAHRVALLAGLLTAAFAAAGWFEQFEYWSLSRLFELRGARAPTLPIVIVSVDQSTLTDRKSTRLNSSHVSISYAVFCLQKKTPLKVIDKNEHVPAVALPDVLA